MSVRSTIGTAERRVEEAMTRRHMYVAAAAFVAVAVAWHYVPDGSTAQTALTNLFLVVFLFLMATVIWGTTIRCPACDARIHESPYCPGCGEALDEGDG